MRQAVAILAVTGLVVGGLFGGGVIGEPSTDGQPSAAAFCSAVQEVQQAGDEAFGEADQNASPQELQDLQREFVAENEALFDQVVESAPPEIRGDAEVVIAETRAAAGLGEAPSPEETQAASERIAQYGFQNC